MANPKNRPSRQNFRFAAPVMQLVPSRERLLQLANKVGGSVDELCATIGRFMTKRQEVAGWTQMNDAASRDRFTYGKTEADRKELETPVPSLTTFLGARAGEGWDRDAILSALAALASEPEAAKHGLSIQPGVNANVDQPYATVGIYRRSGALLTKEQQDLFADV